MNYISSLDTVNRLINLIETKENGIYIRFGDGDFYLMEGSQDMLARPSQEMTDNYKLLMNKLKPSDMISIPFYCKGLNTLEEGMEPGVHESPDSVAINLVNKIKLLIPDITTLYGACALHQVLVHHPNLYVNFLKAIIKNGSTIIIGNKDFNRENIKFYFGNNTYIGGNSNNSFYERERIWSEFDTALDNVNDFTVCILALGCGGRAMAHKFIDYINSKNKKVLIIDIGSSIDVLMGLNNTRAWIEITKPDIENIKNLMKNYNITYCENRIKTLTRLGIKYNTDKSSYHNYTDFYDSLFCFNKDNIKNIIEVGVAGGASIQMWREYFTNCTIYCFDIKPEQAPHIYNLSNVIFRYTNQDFKDSIKESVKDIEENSVDIIIDDGGHFSTQQRNTLEVLWPLLKSGGTFIIEDIHTNVKHWYPMNISWNNNKKYWDETPTILESLTKIQYGLHISNLELDIPVSEVKQIIIWTQPETTSATAIIIKK